MFDSFEALQRSPRIVIVGVCASGKSLLTKNLLARGYDAHPAAQEHSYVPTMWQMTSPDLLIYLDASMRSIRRRRQVSWGLQYLRDEQKILRHARTHCHLYINTDNLTSAEVLAQTLSFLAEWQGPRHGDRYLPRP